MPTEIRILDAAGGLVRSLTKTAPCPAAGAVTSVAWDGRNAARALVPPGTYGIEIIATDSAGNTSATGRAAWSLSEEPSRLASGPFRR